MENFLPALLIIGSVIYKIYSEYKKNQEQARSRIPSQRPAVPTQTSKRAVPPPVPSYTAPKQIIQEKTEESYRNKYVPEKFQKEGPKKRNRVVPKVLELEIIPEKPFKFNLRDAIIQQTILERPYK